MTVGCYTGITVSWSIWTCSAGMMLSVLVHNVPDIWLQFIVKILTNGLQDCSTMLRESQMLTYGKATGLVVNIMGSTGNGLI